MKDLFAKLRIKNHLTAAGIRKCEGYSLLACLLEQDEQSQTIGDLFRQLEEETGKITFLERLRQYLSALLGRIFDTLAHFYDLSPMFRAYLDVITNAFNDSPILQGCER